MEIQNRPSAFHDERAPGSVIDTVVIHSMHCPDAADPADAGVCIARLAQFEVSAHYVIDRAGNSFRLVPDEKRAWHAGVSKMHDGREGANHFSIGIELLGKNEDGFTPIQYQSLFRLIVMLSKRFPLRFVVGHDHIAQPPGRKSDPGPRFDWAKLKRLLEAQNSTREVEFPFL